MERIKKALERAREAQTSTTSRVHVPAGPQEAHPSENTQLGLTSKISYSQTREFVVDDNVLSANRIISALRDDEALTAYRLLRTQVEHRLSAKGWNALAITSPGANQGKTLTAINLAISLAYEVHRTVLLVDLDLRNPSIHKRFGQSRGPGIVDYLYRDVPLSDILVNPGIERLVILPGSEAIANSSETLASPRMANLVDELKTRYPSRFVIFDLPPMLSADDALAFSPYVDAVLIVVEDGATNKDELARSLELLGDANVLGTVLNKSTERQSTYYYN